MWLNKANVELWPLALEHRAYLWNHLPCSDSQLAPLEIFSFNRFSSYENLHSLHIFGFPVNILNPKLQDGNKLPKWSYCSCSGQYMGVSPHHSSTTSCILNLTTGFVITQYHMVWNYQFVSIPNSSPDGLFADNPFNASIWKKFVKYGLERHINQEDLD